MRKIRVIKDMPGIKAGSISVVYSNGMIDESHYCVEYLVKEGWVEWVKEPLTLESKYKEIISQETIPGDVARYLSEIAKAHYLEAITSKDIPWEGDPISLQEEIFKVIEEA